MKEQPDIRLYSSIIVRYPSIFEEISLQKWVCALQLEMCTLPFNNIAFMCRCVPQKIRCVP